MVTRCSLIFDFEQLLWSLYAYNLKSKLHVTPHLADHLSTLSMVSESDSDGKCSILNRNSGHKPLLVISLINHA